MRLLSFGPHSTATSISNKTDVFSSHSFFQLSAMGKVKSTLMPFLNRDLSWSYQEILAECILVLWFATKVSLELSRQFFPEWRESRIDPELFMAPETALLSEKSLSRLFLGADSTGCFWSRAASFWKQHDDSRCLNGSLPHSDPDVTKIAIGYYGTFLVLLTTAALYFSFFCSLFVNRHWRLPAWHVPYWDSFGRHCDRNFEENKDRRESETIWATLLCFFAGILTVAAAAATIGGWLVFLVWPVVVLATVVAHAIVAAYGDEALFPCFVVITCIMAVYCTGRIWGMWMKDCYLNSIVGLIKKIRGKELAENEAKPSIGLREPWGDSDISWIMKLWPGCFIVSSIVWPFVGRQFPNIFEYLPFERLLMISHDCLRISNSTDNLDHTDALLSYWVAANDLFDNATGVSLPEVPPSSQAIGRIYLVWDIILLVACSWVVYVFILIGIGMYLYASYEFCQYCYQAYHRRATKDSTLTQEDTERLTLSRISENRIIRPHPNDSLDGIRIPFVILSDLFTWLNLYLALEFFLPERYQLPGILVLTTCLMMWLYRLAIPGFIATWCGYRREQSHCGEGRRLLESKNESQPARRMTL